MNHAEIMERLQEIAEGRWSTWNQFAYDQEHGPERAAMCDAMEAVKLAAIAQALPPTTFVNVVFDGPPSATPGRFVELEADDGHSIRGEWKDRGDGTWVLRLPVAQVAVSPWEWVAATGLPCGSA